VRYIDKDCVATTNIGDSSADDDVLSAYPQPSLGLLSPEDGITRQLTLLNLTSPRDTPFLIYVREPRELAAWR